jgi:hypothetical protein
MEVLSMDQIKREIKQLKNTLKTTENKATREILKAKNMIKWRFLK